MAVIKTSAENEDPISYVATLAFFCCVSCVVLMLKFRGFRASMNLSSWTKRDNETEPSVSMTGAYRINRDEFYGSGSIIDPPKKLTPSMVKLPQSSQSEPSLRPTKSTSDLARPNNLPENLNRSSHDVSLDPRGRPATNTEENSAPTRPMRKEKDKSQDKEQKKLEKKRLAEQKSREKAEAQEQARKDKIRKEAEKKAAQEQAKATKAYRKKAPPIPQVPSAPVPPTTPHVLMANPLAMNPAPSYSTNTLESSISRTSGPPPYAEIVESEDSNTAAGNSNPSNVSFSKPIDNPSWDLISQHRQQMSRPATSAVQRNARKNLVLDLQYKFGSDDKDNTDA